MELFTLNDLHAGVNKEKKERRIGADSTYYSEKDSERERNECHCWRSKFSEILVNYENY